MQKRKCERRNQFVEVLEQIQKISNEVHRSSDYPPTSMGIDETDLSSRKLEELHRELQALQKEKVIASLVYSFTSFSTAIINFKFV